MNGGMVWGAASRVGLIGAVGAIMLTLVWYHYFKRIQRGRVLDRTGTLLRYFSSQRLVIKAVLAGMAIISLCVALMHPRWGLVEEAVVQRGHDVYVAFDVSRSMLTRDVSPDRLSVAKHAIKAVVNQLQADRFGLMLFSQRARVACPLTHDKELFSLFIDQLDGQMIGDGSTCLDTPIRLTIEQCKRTPECKQRLLVLVTDGEDFSGTLQAIGAQAAQEHIKILVIGVGTSQGAPVPLYDGQGKQQGFIKDAQGRVVISRLNKTALQSLVGQSDGRYVFIDRSDGCVKEIVWAIERCQKEQRDTQMMGHLQEQYAWFVLVAFCCLLLEWLL